MKHEGANYCGVRCAGGGLTAHGAGPVRRVAVWLALCLALAVTAPGQSGSFDWGTAALLDPSYPGIKRAYVAVTSPRNMKINCLQIDTTVPGLRFYTTPAGSPPEVISQTTRQFITASRSTDKQLVAAINANPWYPYNAWEWNTPKSQNLTGLAVSEGALVSPGDGTATFLISQSGMARMTATQPSLGVAYIDTAVSGFGFVLADGVPVTGDGSIHPRTGIGLSLDRRYVYFMTIDGRQTASAGATTDEVGAYLRYFGSYTGINMDGGGSTTMAWWDPGALSCQLLNVPVGNPYLNTGERYNANNIGVYYGASYIDPPSTNGPITVSNSSFENPVVSEFTWIGTGPGTPNLGGNLPGWNWDGGNPGFSALQPSGGSDGAQWLYLNGARAYQDFNIATAGWTYTLTVDAEKRAGGLTLWFEAWDPFDETNTYVITTLGFDTSTLPDEGWNTVSLQYTIPGANEMDPNSILRISLQAPGTDAFVDNVRLDAVPASAPTISIARNESSMAVTWTGGNLESTTDLTAGPWTSVPGASSPYIFTPSEPKRFFRAVQP